MVHPSARAAIEREVTKAPVQPVAQGQARVGIILAGGKAQNGQVRREGEIAQGIEIAQKEIGRISQATEGTIAAVGREDEVAGDGREAARGKITRADNITGGHANRLREGDGGIVPPKTPIDKRGGGGYDTRNRITAGGAEMLRWPLGRSL